MLDTTRAYALEKLEASGGMRAVASRRTNYYCKLFERAEEEEKTLPAAEWLAQYGWHIDNVRAALDWVFSPEGDAATGIALTAAAIPVWMRLSLLTECRDRIERALAVIGASLDASHEMLTDLGANFHVFSEQALILQGNLSDFDSAMRRFESSDASQPEIV
jgi:predicted ATPase